MAVDKVELVHMVHEALDNALENGYIVEPSAVTEAEALLDMDADIAASGATVDEIIPHIYSWNEKQEKK